MSRTIDERVVSMQFDNKQFENNVQTSLSTLDKLKKALKLDDAAKGLDGITTAAKKCNLSPLSNSIETVGLKFNGLYTIADQAFRNMYNSAEMYAKRIVSAFTVDPIKTGFQEYETQINAIQTILANTESKGETLGTVNRALDTLNTYADKTIYNFTEMTRNIGTFTAAGVELDTAVNSIQGIANLAAISGSSSQQASTAMYQLSQALAAGTVKLMDWNSVVNAGMGGQVFQDALKETARVHGIAIDQMIKDEGSFRETLSQGWITSDILTETLEKFTATTEGLTKEQIESNRQMWLARGYTEDQVDAIFKLGKTSTDAATKVKTFTQLWDTLKEAAQSGWTQTWELIIGDFGEAKELWTSVSDTIGEAIGKSAERRNTLLSGALMNNYDKLIAKVNEAGVETSEFEKRLRSVLESDGYDVDKLLEKYGSFEDIFQSGAVGADKLKKALNGVGDAMYDISGIEGIFKFGSKGDEVTRLQDALMSLGYDLGKYGADGIYGSVTKAAVEAFQKANGLKVDGIIGPETLAALEKAGTATSTIVEGVDELIEGVRELGGRELIIESLKNAFYAIVKPLGKIKEAWKETFSPMTSDQLFGIIEKVHAFSEKLIMSDESAEKVKKTFRGLFAVLEILKTIVGGGLGVAFKLLSKILGNFDLNILDVAAAAGDALVKFRDWVFENNILAKGFDKIVTGIAKGVVSVRDWIKEFIKMPKVQATIKRFSKAFSESFGKIKSVGSDVWKIIKQFVSSLKSMKTFSIEDIGEIFKTFGETIREYFTKIDISSIFSSIAAAIKKFKEDVSSYFESVGIKFDEIRQKIVDFVTAIKEKLGDNMGSILAVGVLATFLFIMKKATDAVKTIAKSFGIIGEFFGGLGENLGDFFEGLGKTLKSFSQAAKASALKNVAISIAILAASVAVLALLDQKKVWSSVGAITVLAAELIAMSFVLSKFKLGDFGKITGSILAISGAIMILALAMKALGGLDSESLIKGGIAIAAFLAMFAVISATVKNGDMWVGEFGKMMLKLSFALLIVAGVVKIFGSMDTSTLIRGGLAVTYFLGLMVAMMASTKLLANDIPKFGSMMLGLGAALVLMAVAVKILGGMDTSAMIQGGLAVSAFLLMMIGMMKATKAIGSEAGKFGSMMFGIGAALLLMSASIAILGNMDTETIVKGSLTVAAMMGLMVIMMAATKLLGKNSGDTAKVGAMMLSFAAALLIMSASIALLSVINEEAINKAVGAITKIGLVFGALVALSRFAGESGKCKSTIMTLSVAVAILAVSVAALSFINPDKLKGATIALSVVMGVFALLVASTGLIKTSAGTMVSLAAILVIMSGALILLAKMPIENTLTAAASLSALILSLSASCLLLSFVPITGALTGVASLAILIAGIGIIMAAIAGLSKAFPGMEEFLNTSIPLLTAIGEGLGAFVGGIVGGFAAGVTAGLPEIGTNLSNFMTNLTPFIEGAKGIGEDSMAGVKNLAETILILCGANLVESITSFITGGSSLADFANQLVPFGTAMAQFSSIVAGNIDEEAVTAAANAGKIMAEMATTLPNSGGVVGFFAGENDMSTFASQLVPFGNAISQFSSIVSGNINEEAVTAAANAGKLMAEMATTIPNTGGVVSFFAGDNDIATFATGLVPFGTAIKAFSTEVAGLDESAVTSAATAGKMMAEMAATIPNSGGIVTWFAGDNNMTTFGTELVAFGTAMKNFSTEVTGLDESAVTAAATAGSMMAEMAATIPNSGGIVTWFSGDNDMTTFGTELVAFGKAMKDFSSEVSGLDEGAVTVAATAGTSLVSLANSLPESGGLWSVFAKDNDMSTFASEIKKFGGGIKGFSESVSGIDTQAIASASTVGGSLSRMAKSLTADSIENLGDFGGKLKSFGGKLQSFAEDMANINVESLSNVITEIGNLTSLDLSSVESLGTTLSTIGTDAVQKFLSSFENANSRFQTAGIALINNFVTGINTRRPLLLTSSRSMASSMTATLKSYMSSFYDAGKYLVQGFALGISANSFRAEAKAKAMASAALSAAKRALDEHSPSREAYKVGAFFGEGFVNAIDDYGKASSKAGAGMAESAKDGLSKAVSAVRDIVENGIDAQPTIRPVLDLSNVESGAGAISGMLGTPSVRAMSNIGAISSMMSSGQNGLSNADVVSAINNLGKKLGNMSGDTYNVGGVTYDDGSNVSNAVKEIVRAARIERRS